ncbi:MAG: hypothetical protein AAF204_05460 [Pseudomonadota bacterium]
MKNTFKTMALCVAVLGLAACESGLGNFDDAPPYELNRTATHTQAPAPAPAPEPAPEPAPMCEACEDCGAWEARALQAEKDLMMCKESTTRVRDAYREELKK